MGSSYEASVMAREMVRPTCPAVDRAAETCVDEIRLSLDQLEDANSLADMREEIDAIVKDRVETLVLRVKEQTTSLRGALEDACDRAIDAEREADDLRRRIEVLEADLADAEERAAKEESE